MIRKVKIQPLTGDEAPFVVSVAIGETVKNNVAIPSGYNKEDVYFFFQNLKDFKTAFTEDAEFIEEHIKGGEFCSFRILEDMGLESEEVKYVVVNWCASDEEDSAGCFSQYFNSEDEAVEFLRKDLIEFIEENNLLIEDVNTDFEGDGEYKSIDDIPLIPRVVCGMEMFGTFGRFKKSTNTMKKTPTKKRLFHSINVLKID